MAAALTFLRLGRTDVKLYLFDTFSGMTEPSEVDRDRRTGQLASVQFQDFANKNENWCEASKEDVVANITSTDYPMANIKLVQGRVEDTIPAFAPTQISLLRLDTDWYQSTRHELEHLFPRLARGGVLIIDDYGHWEGARKAVDEYFSSNGIQFLLNRIDYTGRVGVKL